MYTPTNRLTKSTCHIIKALMVVYGEDLDFSLDTDRVASNSSPWHSKLLELLCKLSYVRS